MSSLNEIDVATPLNGATPQQLLEEVRALKYILKSVLLTGLNPDGTLKTGSVSSVAAGTITEAGLVDSSVTAPKIANGAVTTDKLGTGSVTAAKMGAGSVTEAKYGAASIPTAAFKPNSLPIASLAGFISREFLSKSASVDSDRAVTADHIANGAVIDRTITSMALAKLIGGADGDFLFNIGGVWSAVPVSGALSYDSGTNTFVVENTLMAAVVGDAKARGSDGGTATPSVWNLRALGEIFDPNSIVTFFSSSFSLLSGLYVVYIKCPACQVGKHQARLFDVTNSEPKIWGSSESAVGTTNQTDSVICGLLDVSDAATVYELQHYVEATVGATDFGRSTSSDNTTVYSSHREVYTSGFLIKIG